MITVKNLNYEYPQLKALDNVSFSLPQGSINALVGPNGAGKTTLLRNIAGLLSPFSGEIFLNGEDVVKYPQKTKGLVGYLPDYFGLYSDLTAFDCLTYSAWSHGLRNDEAETSVKWAIEQVDLKEQLHRQATQLSRGQRQRLALAQCIVYRPKILLLDEPASGLDPQARENIAELMKNLAKEGMTIVVSSHILAELDSYCTNMLILEKGKILSVQENEGKETVSTKKPAVEIDLTVTSDQHDRLSELCSFLNTQNIQTKIIDQQIIGEAPLDENEQYQLLQTLITHQWKIKQFNVRKKTLNDYYKKMVNANQSMKEQS